VTWNTPSVQWMKVTASEYKFIKVLQPDEIFVAKWK